MKKYLLIIILLLLVLCGCNKESNDSKFYLNKKYYNTGEYIKTKSSSINNNKDSYILYTYNNYCSLAIPCEDIFEEFMKQYKIDFLSIPFDDFKDTYLYDKVKYGPTIIIVKNGKIVSYLDANNDEDIEKYQDVEKFKDWVSNYIYLEKK